MQELEQVPEHHPLRRAITVLRSWLVMLTAMMLWNALVARPYLLHGWVRPLPYLVLAATGAYWAKCVWDGRTVIICTAIVTVGTMLRGVEVMGYSDATLSGRLTGISLWFMMAGTAMSFGVLNLIAISRREADEWILHRGV